MMPRKAVFYFALMLILWIAAACGADPQPAPDVASPPASSQETEGALADSAPATPTAVVAIASEAQAEIAPSDEAPGGVTVYHFDPAATEARFLVDEILLGQDKTVIGATSLVSGTISVDLDDPSTAGVGLIEIDARDFTTDSRRRNTSISRYILQSVRDEYRYITFAPTAIEGVPDAVAVDQPVEVSIVGDLTIRDVTQTERFTTTVTRLSDGTLQGLAMTIVQRGDYDLTIPSVPSVAGVSEEVRLELEFSATAAD